MIYPVAPSKIFAVRGLGGLQQLGGPAAECKCQHQPSSLAARLVAMQRSCGAGTSHPLAAACALPRAPLQAAPEEKGVLAESQLVSEYLLPTQSVLGEGDVVNGTTFWQTATALVSNFLLPDDEGSLAKRLPRCYASAAEEAEGCPKAAAQAAAAKKLGAELERIGAAIEAREKSTEGKLPRYDLLIPANLPCGTTI